MRIHDMSAGDAGWTEPGALFPALGGACNGRLAIDPDAELVNQPDHDHTLRVSRRGDELCIDRSHCRYHTVDDTAPPTEALMPVQDVTPDPDLVPFHAAAIAAAPEPQAITSTDKEPLP